MTRDEEEFEILLDDLEYAYDVDIVEKIRRLCAHRTKFYHPLEYRCVPNTNAR